MLGERQPFRAEISHKARYRLAAKFVKPSDSVLDVFCGSGYGSHILANTGATVLAFDKVKDDEFIEHPGILFIKSEFPNTFINGKSFDTICCFEAIEHVDEITGHLLLSMIRKWLKTDGTLWISTPNIEFLPFNSSTHPYHKLHYSHFQLEELLIKTGFPQIEWFNQARKGSHTFRTGPSGTFMIAKCS